jgi:hypothetical protein
MVPKGKPRVAAKVSGIKLWMLFKSTLIGPLLGPAPTATGTITLDPTFGSFTLLELVSY